MVIMIPVWVSCYLKKNAIGVKNRKKTVISTDEKIPILGDQNIEIYGFVL